MMQSLAYESKKCGLQMNANKTKVMTNSIQRPVKVFGQQIDYIQEYVYLGKQVSFNKNSNKEEVNRRINSTWKKRSSSGKEKHLNTLLLTLSISRAFLTFKDFIVYEPRFELWEPAVFERKEDSVMNVIFDPCVQV
ncbi:Putative uncharacterized transposon-derived protein F52C9.6 [Eumeta japonica]|uniref:Uncharacterized transposon-derived protein F52C9.6 n=1 Tax=Eumeta variegata TaxID=151549 RepID=A0A4C1ZZS4_EUMVA|nr:Putative uncharacterized transposon-derived protein F52C9.6 [Eumeta japonica]